MSMTFLNKIVSSLNLAKPRNARFFKVYWLIIFLGDVRLSDNDGILRMGREAEKHSLLR